MIRNRTVPRPENNSVVAGGNPVSTGTRNVAPNIATTCWAPMPMVRGQLSRSSGATTYASDATGFQLIISRAGITVVDYTPSADFPRLIGRMRRPRRSVNVAAAVDVNGGSGQVAGVFARQEGDHGRHLLCGGGASDRDPRGQGCLGFV